MRRSRRQFRPRLRRSGRWRWTRRLQSRSRLGTRLRPAKVRRRPARRYRRHVWRRQRWRPSRALRYASLVDAWAAAQNGGPCVRQSTPARGRSAPHQHAVHAEPGRLPARDGGRPTPITSARFRTRGQTDHVGRQAKRLGGPPYAPLHAITACRGRGAPAGHQAAPPRGAECEMRLAATARWRQFSEARRWRPRLRRLRPMRSMPVGPCDASSGGEDPRRT